MEDDFEANAVPATEDRPRGVSKAKLSDVNLGPKISIFYRLNRNDALVPLEVSFPRELAKIFCDRIRADVESSNVHSYIVTGVDQTAYKKIFSWIKDCAQSQSIEKFPDLPEPEDDPFTDTVNVIIAGHRLGVPAGSLSYHLEKRLKNCARKNLMPLSQVREFYNIDPDTYNFDLKAVACTSVFNAWWDGRLDASVNPEVMEELADLRDELRELDDDLHKACKKREEEVRKKWAEKRAKKIAEANEDGDGWNHAGNTTDNTAAGGMQSTVYMTDSHNDWDTAGGGFAQATTSTGADWDNENVKSGDVNTVNGGSHSQKIAVHDFAYDDYDEAGGKDWADEMNEPAPEPPQTVPMLNW